MNDPWRRFEYPSSVFEKSVLANSTKLFKPSKKKWPGVHPIFNPKMNRRNSLYNPNGTEEEDEDALLDDKKSKSLWWWQPDQNSLFVEFCEETSTHGLKFMTKPKRHMSERIFWVISFTLGLLASVYLINEVWRRYKASPVIVTFQPKEQDIDTIPFPAVTFCNINKFPKYRIEELQKIAFDNATTPAERKKAQKYLVFARSVCNAQHSFAEEFNFTAARGVQDDLGDNDIIEEDEQAALLEFLIDNTIPCDQLIRLCIFAEEIKNCGELFKPIVTDYGKCCTFNMLPTPLLLTDPGKAGIDDSVSSSQVPATDKSGKSKNPWTEKELREWKLWKYSDGMVLPKNLTYPHVQKRAGMPYGLSILVDPHVDEYYCPSSDSEGLRYILHTALEMPHVMEFASILELGKEIYVEINPEVTNADDAIRHYTRDIRQCYFAGEKTLKFFQPYTGSNCIDECTAIVITKTCNCSFFYLPHEDGVRICNTDKNSNDSKCINRARVGLLNTLKDECGHCDNLCEDIAYHYQTTVSALQDPKFLWKDVDTNKTNMTIPQWADNKMSIVHLYFGADTTVPKLRQRMFDDVDLIASTGGLLGLCLGVSVLSAVEALYYCTLRLFWKLRYRKRTVRNLATKFTEILKRKIRRSDGEKERNSFLMNERSVRNGGFGDRNPGDDGMFHLNNQLQLRKSRGTNGIQHFQSYY